MLFVIGWYEMRFNWNRKVVTSVHRNEVTSDPKASSSPNSILKIIIIKKRHFIITAIWMWLTEHTNFILMCNPCTYNFPSRRVPRIHANDPCTNLPFLWAPLLIKILVLTSAHSPTSRLRGVKCDGCNV